MPKPPEFLLDENVDARLKEFLRKQGFEIISVPKGATDQQVFKLCIQKKAILITNDKDFFNTDLYEVTEKSAIVLLKIHPPSYTKTKTALSNLLKYAEVKKVLGRTIILSETGIEVL